MLSLFAQVGGMSLGQLAIAIIIICGLVAIVIIACRAMGVPIPPWLVQILVVVLVVIVAIAAIKFIIAM
jgi:hypothetical protein